MGHLVLSNNFSCMTQKPASTFPHKLTHTHTCTETFQQKFPRQGQLGRGKRYLKDACAEGELRGGAAAYGQRWRRTTSGGREPAR